ncbi:MAG TPA: DNA topoisomerase IV [Actinobacteria bacterium]|nr:DNA topoisomerase IV [Actinomycetota bacterium]
MARRSAGATKNSGPSPASGGQIVDIDVSEEMQTSFLEYAYSVIYARALPDARDGLKPVQRRILYGMSQMGLAPDRGHVKCSRVVGEVMGKLHPHGDSAIYDALVRMAQPFSLRLALVDGHGNFGSLDDGPAAMRYTECRPAQAASLLTDSLDEEVVDFVPNYDDRESEPVVLPAAFPQLLVNGATGIAVGLSTSMPPHNLGEVIAAARHLVDHPKATLHDLMKFVPGPDFASGGSIVGLAGIREAYADGKGTFRIRATATIERVSARRTGIVVTELPHGTGPERVIDKIADLVRNKKLTGIHDVTDLTDGENGLRLVVEVKNGFNAEAVLEELYRLTPMEDSFAINNVALVDGRPHTLGLKELLEVFLGHRFEVVQRRSRYRKRRAEERAHIVDGLLIALDAIDDVIHIIRNSEDAAQARTRLAEAFELSEIQTQHILDMPLRRLTSLEVGKLRSELDELRRRIAELDEILTSDTRLRQVVSAELQEVAHAHANPRRTVLLESLGRPATSAAPTTAKPALEVPDAACRILLSSTGLLARTAAVEAETGDAPRARHDVIVSTMQARTRGPVGLVTSLGRVVRVSAVDLPEVPATNGGANAGGGVAVAEVVALESKERVIALVPVPLDQDAADQAATLAVGTRQGVVKRVTAEPSGTKDAWSVIALKPGDEVVGAACVPNESANLVFITSDAQLLRTSASAVRPQGRGAAGMAGIRLNEGADAVFFGVVDTGFEAEVVTVAGSSSALPGADATSVKITAFDEFPSKGRGTAGVRCHRFLKGEDQLVLAWAGSAPARAAGPRGAAVALPEEYGRRDGSGIAALSAIAAISGPA